MRTEAMLPFERSDKQMYPVSITWQPPFTMLVDLVGQGDAQVLNVSQVFCCARAELRHTIDACFVHSQAHMHAVTIPSCCRNTSDLGTLPHGTVLLSSYLCSCLLLPLNIMLVPIESSW